VGLRVGVDVVEKRKILPLPGSEPRAVQPVAIPIELSQNLNGGSYGL
jgi:hypothetical protein